MRIDKNYIEMCWKAREIQDKWQIRLGDLYINSRWIKYYESSRSQKMEEDIKIFSGSSQAIEGKEFIKDNFVWLPRVDELYEIARIIDGDIYFPISLMEKITKTWREHKDTVFCLNRKEWDSLEQIWLAFIMLIQHQKAWDDISRDWIDATERIKTRTGELIETGFMPHPNPFVRAFNAIRKKVKK